MLRICGTWHSSLDRLFESFLSLNNCREDPVKVIAAFLINGLFTFTRGWWTLYFIDLIEDYFETLSLLLEQILELLRNFIQTNPCNSILLVYNIKAKNLAQIFLSCKVFIRQFT